MATGAERLRALAFLAPAGMIAGLLCGRTWVLHIVGWLFLLAPILDILAGSDPRNPPASAGRDRSTWLWAPLLAVLLYCGLATVSRPSASVVDLVACTFSVGMVVGTFGISAAHELMHRPGRFERALAEALMAMASYPHFCIEHVEGHHRNVGTANDPATARLGESFYAFLPRSVAGGLLEAWRLEAARLRRRGLPALHARNRMLRYAATLTLLYVAIGIVFGWRGVALFAGQGLIAVSILEAINYVQHYGLTRRETAGRRERVSPRHAWSADHRVTNWCLLNLARHADHHCEPRRVYRDLRHLDASPTLPAGYFTMFALALFPPLWRRVMDPRAEAWRLQA